MKKISLIILLVLILLLLGPLFLLLTQQVMIGQNWRTANHNPSHVLAEYHINNTAAIVLLSAKAFSWRGMFSTHTWLATKLPNQNYYTIYQVIGWNQYRNKPIVDISHGIPDRNWYGNKPKVEDIMLGSAALQLIPKIQMAVKHYSYAKYYHAWPGPNSNTFTNYVIQSVPALHFQMPYNALGRDYQTQIVTSGFSVAGVFGAHFSPRQQYLILLGLTIGFSWQPLGFIIPGMGLLKI
jgi:hypothetical protein